VTHLYLDFKVFTKKMNQNLLEKISEWLEWDQVKQKSNRF
jgi:hypothetical protein